MRSAAAIRRLVLGVAFLSALAWATPAHAQFAAGTTWVRTDMHIEMTMTLSACCNGGLRLTYQIPGVGGQAGTTMSVDSALNGADAPVLVAGKPSGETMAIKRNDDHHYVAVVKMNGQPFGTSTGVVAADGKTMTVETVSGIGSASQKIIETWVRK